MATNFLNVDELAPVKKTLTLKGKTHVMHQVTVQEFIDIVSASAAVGEVEFESLPLGDRVIKLVENIQKAFPTIPNEDLQGLTLDQLIVVTKFVSGTLEEEAEAATEKKAA